MIKLFIKLVTAVLIIPVAIAMTLAFCRNILLIKELANSFNVQSS